MDPDSCETLLRRRDAGTLTWRGPALMLFARAACAVGAQALVAAIFALRSSPTPWHDAEPWLPVYGTLIDAGCLALLWRLTRREGIRLFDLVGFERTRPVRDALLGLALYPGEPRVHPWWHVCGRLALVRHALTAVLLWTPAIAGRCLRGAGVAIHLGTDRADDLQWLSAAPLPSSCRGTSLAIAIVAFVWALQHAFMPLTFDARFMAFRLLSAVPYSVFLTCLYLRLRRLVPLAIAHALMDGASVLISVLLPLLRA
jgi:hypothetical protein